VIERQPRTFLHFEIAELEAVFSRQPNDSEFLRSLIAELDHRKTDRAQRLKARAKEALAKLQKTGTQRPPDRERSRPQVPRREAPPPPEPESHSPSTDSEGPSQKAQPEETLFDAWTALEVLSPPSFRRPEDLKGGDRKAVASLERERLPWEGEGEKSRPNMRLYYQVVLGSVDLGRAVPQLLARYSDLREERPAARGEAITAVLIVDRNGRLSKEDAIQVSSFAWGLPLALRGDLGSLAEWLKAEPRVIKDFDGFLRQRLDSDENEQSPLDRATLQEAWEWLLARLELPRELVNQPRFAVRCYEYFRRSAPPEPLLLNSFFLADLARAKWLFRNGRAPSALRRYVGSESPGERRDLFRDPKALEEALAPRYIPPARWPAPWPSQLVLLQQAGVNLAIKDLNSTGILAINGPPGTGKTTLLRDLVAAIVSARAEAMATFDDPAQAFVDSREKERVADGSFSLYRVDSRLKGFEIVVASSNNKAVENVSAELPDLKAVSQDLRYLRVLSDALHGRETWGLIAAVLGNAANVSRFRQTFWWDKDRGLSAYLAEAAGTPQLVEVLNPETGERETRPPSIVEHETPPRSPVQAAERWRQARATFLAALQRSRKNLDDLEAVRASLELLPVLVREESRAAEDERIAREQEIQAGSTMETARIQLDRAEEEQRRCEDRLQEHDRASPPWWSRLFRTRRARTWSSGRMPLLAATQQARKSRSEAARAVSTSDEELLEAAAKRRGAELFLRTARQRHLEAQQTIERARAQGGVFIDQEFWALPHAERHQVTPWLNDEHQRARDDVFVAAIALHKAFLDAAARPIRDNLGVLMKILGGGGLPTEKKQALIGDLWSSLFLVVPVVSTTFASVGRMFGRVPEQALGWLFIDEAGQALPQAAVGAIFRSKRAVVVGDPVQIEPIVTLPESLTMAICKDFGVDPDRFNAPAASAQTLADAATPYFAEFHGRSGSRTVGVPLLVHRRCAEPMFGIANAVAYHHLMVSAKKPMPSRIGDLLGPSAWIHVQGSAMEKWCPEEGNAVLALLRVLATAEVEPNLYIVTPFVTVSQNLRKLVRESPFAASWLEDGWTSQHIGTVHTVQGREAEAVIFVLGAPAPHQTGARNWAGGRPNLLNVAVTRAKERLYVIGNRDLWREAGLFRELDSRLPASSLPGV
jgi:hypothetical protein